MFPSARRRPRWSLIEPPAQLSCDHHSTCCDDCAGDRRPSVAAGPHVALQRGSAADGRWCATKQANPTPDMSDHSGCVHLEWLRLLFRSTKSARKVCTAVNTAVFACTHRPNDQTVHGDARCPARLPPAGTVEALAAAVHRLFVAETHGPTLCGPPATLQATWRRWRRQCGR